LCGRILVSILTNMRKSNGVIIVGGGIGGLALAIALARTGRPVRVLERAASFGEIGAGLQLAPNASRALDCLGVLERVRESVVTPQRMLWLDARTAEPLTELDLGEPFRERYGYDYLVMHRSDLLAALLDAARAHPAITLETDAEISAVDGSGAVARVTSVDGRERVAWLVVGLAPIAVAMGSASNGPLLVQALDYPRLGERFLFDVTTMKVIDGTRDHGGKVGALPGNQLRASPDGRAFTQKLNVEFDRAQRDHESVSVMAVDLDALEALAHELGAEAMTADLAGREDVERLTAASGHETNKLLRLVQSRLGPEGNYVHRGNTSSDVLDTSLALQMLASLEVIEDDLRQVEDVLRALALQQSLDLKGAIAAFDDAFTASWRDALPWLGTVALGFVCARGLVPVA